MMMERHKYLALAMVAGLMAAAAPALAQTGTPPKSPAPADSGHRMKDPISRMLEQQDQLKLTDDQVRQLEQIRTKYQEKYKDHLEQMRRSREARSALRAGMDSARAEIAGVLTPEQEKQVETMREEWRREWKDAHRERHHGGAHGEHEHEGDSKDG
jgi:Spy/CpxP family protein refolding chaperone